MKKFLLDTTIGMSNRAWKLAGKQGARPVGLKLSLPDARLAKMCEATLDEIVERVAFPFGSKLRTMWLQSSAEPTAASATETAFAAMLLRHWDAETAWELLKVFFLNRSLEGKMPQTVGAFNASPHPAYPFVLLALCRMFDSTSDEARTRELFRKYLKYADWLVIYHKAEGGLYNHRDEGWFKHDFLVSELAGAEHAVESRWRDVFSVGLNSIMAYQYRLLSRAAFCAGEQRDGKKLDNHAKKLAMQLNEKFWDAEKAFYFDMVGEARAQAVTPSGLLPLVAEAPIRSQAEAMLARLPEISTALIQELGSKEYNAVHMYLLADGLAKYGLIKESGALAWNFVDCAAGLPDEAETFLQRTVAVNALLEQVLGYYNFGGRLVLFPNLPEAWKGAQLKIEDTFRNLVLEFALGENSQVDYRITLPGGRVLEAGVENMRFKNVDLAEGAAVAAKTADTEEQKPEGEVKETAS